MGTAGGFRRQLLAHAEAAQRHKAGTPALPLLPDGGVEQAGKSYVEIHCGGLHDRVNEGEDRYAVCSGVMWVETAEGDCDIVDAPPRGAGPGLVIRYGLSRRLPPLGDGAAPGG